MNDDSFCVTRCRRDANCNCEICIDSINATRDLMPTTTQRRQLIKPSPPETPIFFNSSTISTPESHSSRFTVSHTVNSTISQLRIKTYKTAEIRCALITIRKCVLVLSLILFGKLGFLFVSSGFMETKLSPEIIRNLSEKSLELKNVKEQLGFLNYELQKLVGDGVAANPNWEVIQDGLILRSRCQLYKSGTEEVSIWGWPSQTAGLLTTQFDSRFFTILSGRVTEWSNGELKCLIRKANTSWEQGKWSASVMQLDEYTWILEYKRSFVSDNTRLFSSAMELLKFKMTTTFQWVKPLSRSPYGNHVVPT